MNAICYKNTKTTLPGWVNDLHLDNQIGYAYEAETHFIHIYGRGYGLYTISPGLTVCQEKAGTLKDWVSEVFGAVDIQQINNQVGHVVTGIWRPGLFFDDEVFQALDCDEYERRESEQALKILLDKLADLLLYIEPDARNLDTYGHKSRELLILACTEVENQWLKIYKKSPEAALQPRLSTNGYVKLKNKAFLNEYQISFNNYRDLASMSPFKDWDLEQPTQSLDWYDSYNKTKHDRSASFREAKLKHVLSAIAANIILHCVRFSPYGLYNNRTTLSGYINQTVKIELNNCDVKSCYIPFIQLPPNTRKDLFCYNTYQLHHNKPWIREELIL